VVILGRIERIGRNDLSNNWGGEDLLRCQFADDLFGNLLLLVAVIEDRGPVLSADVIALRSFVVGSWIVKKTSRMSR